MLAALYRRDPAYEGVFRIAVRSTGSSAGRIAPPAAVPGTSSFLPHLETPLRRLSGVPPVPAARAGGGPPDWLRPLLAAADADPTRRFLGRRDPRQGVDPGECAAGSTSITGLPSRPTAEPGDSRLRSGRSGMERRCRDRARPGLRLALRVSTRFRSAVVFSADHRVAPSQPIATKRLLTPLGPMLACATPPRGPRLLEFPIGGCSSASSSGSAALAGLPYPGRARSSIAPRSSSGATSPATSRPSA